MDSSVGHAIIDHVFPLTGRGTVFVLREKFAGSIPRNGHAGVGESRWKYSGPEFVDHADGRSQFAIIIREPEAETTLRPGTTIHFWEEPRHAPQPEVRQPGMFDLPHYEVSLGLKLRLSVRIFLAYAAIGLTLGTLGFAAIVIATYFSRTGIQWTHAVAILVAAVAPMTVVGAILGVRDFVRLTLDEVTGRPPEHLRHRVRTKRFE